MSDYNDWNQQIIKEFRANGGKVGGPFAGSTLVLLHTVGAKSGKEHVTPVMSFSFEGELYVVASKAGAPTNPAWYHNMLANPVVTVELGTETFRATAVSVPEPQRSQLYSKVVAQAPGFGEYQSKTERVIPVVRLVS